MPTLNLLSTGSSSHAEQIEPLTTAMHAVDLLLLRWQSTPAPWHQLLQQTFGRSAPFQLTDISVEILDGQTMAGLHGAYAAIAPDGDERIYFNADWLASANAAAVEAVLLEELGHAIDRRLNGTNDTAGDEGAVFSALIRGVEIPLIETSQNDHHNLIINGQQIAIEAAAPVLDTNASPAFTTINANTGEPSGAVGTLVSALIDSGGNLNNFSDADGDSPAIAITGTKLEGGTLYYSTNNGTSWSDVGTVSEASARVLYADSNTRLAFVPAANFSGTISELITFKAWDRESSIANGAASITTTPTLVGSYNTSGWAFAYGVTLSADGSTAFVADYHEGLQIIDVSSTQYFSSNSDTAEITVIDDSRAPILSTAETNPTGTQIILTYNEELSSTTALQSDFEVSTSSAANAVTAVTVDGSSIILTLTTPITIGQQVTIDYNNPTTEDDVNSIQDIVGNDAASLSGLSVANNSTVPDTTAPTLSTAETNTSGTQVILTYDEELSSTAANQSDFEVTTNSATNDVADVTVDDNTVILTLTTPITTGEPATVDYNDPTTGDDEYAIQDIVGNDANSLRSFPLDTISSISCEQMAAFTTQAFAALSRDQIKKIPINAIKCISKPQLSSLPPKAVKGFTSKQIAALSRRVFSAMDEPQLRKLSKKAITGLQKKQINTLSGAELSAFKPRMLKAFPIDAISRLKSKSLDALNKRQVRAFTDDQLAGLNKKRFKTTTQFVGHLSGQQLKDLSPNAVQRFTSKQISVMRNSVFAALSKRQLSKLSKDAITGLQKGQLMTLNPEELSIFKPKNLSEIAPDAISGLRSESLNALSGQQARSFTDDQLADLSKKQIKKADGFMDDLSTQQKNILAIDNVRQARLISGQAITLDDNFALNPAVMDPLA